MKQNNEQALGLYKLPEVTLLNASPIFIGEIAGRICYDSFNMSEHQFIKDFKENPDKFLDNIIEKNDIESSALLDKLINVLFHESVAEHINLTFHVKNVSREVGIEWNRTRIGMPTSQKSTRYTIEDLINAWIDLHDNIHTKCEEYTDKFKEVIKENVIHLDEEFINCTMIYLYSMLYKYNELEPLKKGLKGAEKKAQNDRVKRCLPESWIFEGIWTFNLRSLKHFWNLRDSSGAYFGIREVAQSLKEATPKKYRILIDKKFKKENK